MEEWAGTIPSGQEICRVDASIKEHIKSAGVRLGYGSRQTTRYVEVILQMCSSIGMTKLSEGGISGCNSDWQDVGGRDLHGSRNRRKLRERLRNTRSGLSRFFVGYQGGEIVAEEDADLNRCLHRNHVKDEQVTGLKEQSPHGFGVMDGVAKQSREEGREEFVKSVSERAVKRGQSGEKEIVVRGHHLEQMISTEHREKMGLRLKGNGNVARVLGE